MFKLLHSPKLGGFDLDFAHLVTVTPPSPNLGVSCRQACAVSLCNAVSLRVIWDGLMLPFTLKFRETAPRYWLHSYHVMPDSCSPRGGGR